MAKITHYAVIQDGQVNLVLPAGQSSADFTFDLPGLPQDLARRDDAILTWVVDTDVSGQQLEISLNDALFSPGKVTLTAQLPGTAYQSIHEIIGKGSLRAAGNKLRFMVKGANGVMRISDVVLWWQHVA